MANRLRFAWFTRIAVVAAAFALPLFAVGSAQAAIAGANPASTTNQPDLSSATITGVNTVQVCFDKALSSSSALFGTPAAAWVGGYAANTGPQGQSTPATAALDSNTKCADLTFAGASSQIDLNQFTVATVKNGAVAAATGGATNLYDSTTLTGSTTHNGTTGLSTGPDLVGTVAPTSSDVTNKTVTYVFDQNVSGTPTAANFWIEDASGNHCTGSAIGGVSGSAIVVAFSGLPGCFTGSETVQNAIRAGVTSGSGVFDFSGQTQAPQAGKATPNDAGIVSTIPYLTSAALSSSGTSVTYSFSKTVNTAPDPTQFHVVLSDGAILNGTGTPTISGNTVTVTFGPGGTPTDLSGQNEYAIGAYVSPTAVTNTAAGTINTWSNSPDSAPIGDNAGAFARGFTTGPDVYAVTLNKSNGILTINMDQRACDETGGYITLLNSSGAAVDTLNGATAGPSGSGGFWCGGTPTVGPANPTAVSWQLSALELNANPTMVQFGGGNTTTNGLSTSGDGFGQTFTGCALATDLNSNHNGDECSVPQVVSMITSGAKLRAYHPASHKAKHSKKHSKKHGKKSSKRH
jgi:hypothetical protein